MRGPFRQRKRLSAPSYLEVPCDTVEGDFYVCDTISLTKTATSASGFGRLFRNDIAIVAGDFKG